MAYKASRQSCVVWHLLFVSLLVLNKFLLPVIIYGLKVQLYLIILRCKQLKRIAFIIFNNLYGYVTQE